MFSWIALAVVVLVLALAVALILRSARRWQIPDADPDSEPAKTLFWIRWSQGDQSGP
jgi:predicted small integral membrane protein